MHYNDIWYELDFIVFTGRVYEDSQEYVTYT